MNPRSEPTIWAWLTKGLGVYLLLELGPFFIAKYALRTTVRELVGPYVAFAVPGVILILLVPWLRKSERQGALPKRLARAWGVSLVFFGIAASFATCYSGVKLHLMNPTDAIGTFVTAIVIAVPVLYFSTYHRTLTVISSRAAGRHSEEGAG